MRNHNVQSPSKDYSEIFYNKLRKISCKNRRKVQCPRISLELPTDFFSEK